MSVSCLSLGDTNQDPKKAKVEWSLVMGFSDEDKIGTIQPHDDALVITLRIGDYDVVLLDCSPSLSLLNQNALVVADGILVPVACDFLSLVGVHYLSSATLIHHYPLHVVAPNSEDDH